MQIDKTRPSAAASLESVDGRNVTALNREISRSFHPTNCKGTTGDSLKNRGSARRDQVDSESRLAKAQKLRTRSR
jgi:hypothetical protein